MEEFLQVVLVVAAIGAAIYFSHLQAKKRRRELAALATQLGWRFDPSRDGSHSDRYSSFSAFSRGRSRSAYNTLSGSVEVGKHSFAARAGDFQYTTGSGKNRRTHRLSYLLLHTSYSTPDLNIRRENVLDRVAGAIGFEDIDFESEQFSREFFVKSSDKKFAYDVVHARTMEFLLSGKAPRVELHDGVCCIWDGESKWSPSQFKKRIWWAQKFLELWPDYLTEQLEQ